MSQMCNDGEFGGLKELKSQDGCDGNAVGDSSVNRKKRRFKQPENEAVINDFSSKKFAQNSNNKIKWAVNLYCEWHANRLKQFCSDVEIVRCDLDKLNQFTKSDMSFALSRFIREIKKFNGDDYPLNTLREIIIMIQMYLHKNNVF